ncbi:hypothetical protein PspLS_07019 [Pyricularia sp. CBS 133598]|nr:hypothetical protein PspLS_07019 [Pyricularia sp. CBS 133598]
MAAEYLGNATQPGILGGLFDRVVTTSSPLYAVYTVPILLFAILLYGISNRDPYPDVPFVNPKGRTELTNRRRRAEFIAKAIQLLNEGSEKYKDKPFRMITENGDLLILPAEWVMEIKSNPRLAFSPAIRDDNHAYLPAFAALAGPVVTPKYASSALTKQLQYLTEPISREASAALHDVFLDNTEEWREITPQSIMSVVSRMSCRIFMGEELCNNKDWIAATSELTHALLKLRHSLTLWRRELRPIVYRFKPDAKEVERKYVRCREVLQPYVDRRLRLMKEADARGEKSPYDTGIEWFQRELGDAHDPAVLQINLSIVAIHTTTNLLIQTMVLLAKHPEFLNPMREEVVRVFGTMGITKASVAKLEFMDSCFKEAQRMAPFLTVYFYRKATEDVRLSNGFLIKAGTKVGINGLGVLLNEKIHKDPLTYNPYRWMELRRTPGEESKAQLVSTNSQMFGFGLGLHACPGRFFAASEVKIALAHIVIKYDFELAPGVAELKPHVIGTFNALNPATKLLVRRRKEQELDLGVLGF